MNKITAIISILVLSVFANTAMAAIKPAPKKPKTPVIVKTECNAHMCKFTFDDGTTKTVKK
jgi:hypothetical protein